jgi:type I restriction enzyme S subunit
VSERNENRPGYKKTEVGWIPRNWECGQLQSLGMFLNGLNKDKMAFGRGYPLVNLEDVFEKTAIFKCPFGRVQTTERERRRYNLRRGDILFVRSSVKPEGVGLTMVVMKDLENTVYSGFLIRYRPSSGYFELQYSRYCFHETSFRCNLLRRSTISANTNINQEGLKTLWIPLPPLPEQKKIAEILSTWDEAIEQTRRLIDAKKRRKKALMQQLLAGKKRLSGFKGAWAECSLGDVFNERRDVNSHNLQLLAITGSRGVIPASEIERKDSSNPDKSKYKIIRKGDIGYNTMRMWQGVSAVSDLDGIVSPAYTICIANEDVNVRFMGYFFKFPPIVYLFWRYSQGLVSDTLNLKFNNFAQIKVTIPGLKEQQAITKVLSSADNEIVTLEKKLTALQKQKRGLMQKLLTGEVRVKT